MLKHIYLPLFFLFVQCLSLFASIEIRSTHFTMADGIANNTVRDILQDSKGFIWLGTLNGLSRYDGRSFVNYYPKEGEPSLVDHRVRKMYEDSFGFLWIDVISERQCCYDLKLGHFVDFTGCGEYEQNYSGMIRSSNGDIWVYHDQNGCRRIQCRDDVFSSVVFRKENGNLSSSVVRDVLEDEKGRIWIITRDGVDLVKGDRAENIFQANSVVGVTSEKHTFFVSIDGRIFMEKNDVFKEAAHLPGNLVLTVTGTMLLKDDLYVFTSVGTYIFHTLNKTISRAGVLDIKNGEIQKDNRGNYWIYNHTGKVYYVNADTHVIKSFRLFPEDKMYYIDFERYHFVHDSRDIIWISTYGNGLFAYNTLTDELQHFTTHMDESSHIPSDYLLYVMEDRSGNIWISSEFSGISRLTILNEGATYIYPEGRSDTDDRSNLIRMLTRLKNGHIYAGTRRGGIYLYDKNMHAVDTKYFHSNIYAVAEDADGGLWMGSRGEGLCVEDVWYKHRRDDSSSLSNNHIFSIHRDRKGRMWVGTFHGGLNLAVKGKNGKYTFRHFFEQTYNQRQIRAINEDQNGYLWIGTSDGVYVFHPDSLIADPANYRKYNEQNSNLRSNEIKNFCLDSRGRMWIATSGAGLSMCWPEKNYDNLTFERYDTNNGLVNNMVQSIVEDHQGRIWVATEYGVSCLDADRYIFENYYFSSYILGNTYSDNSACVTEDGRIVFGSGYGMVVIDPNRTRYKSSIVSPLVTLTGLKINGMSVQSGEKDSPLKYSMAYTNRIDLRYEQNSFEVDFSIFDYSNYGTVKYMYKLDNYDKTWSTPSALNFAVYKNIAPGNYVLRVKACNAVGTWSDCEAKLEVTIAPPFWRSTWSYLVYVSLILVVGYGLFKILHNFNALRNRIQVEKQLTEYKLVFFTNISHEFRTPLTLIQGALEKLEGSTNPKDMVYSLKIMNKSTKRMLRLINQLLEFRKMQNNKLTLSLEETDVIAFLNEIFLSFKDTAKSKNMDFRFIPSVDNYEMFIDRSNLDKVSYNLLSNAFKYTPSGGKILFSVMVNAIEKQLIMSVADTGVGIPKEKRDEIFNCFMQSSFSGNSIGVGLYLTRELVHVHKGDIIYSENEGGGSVFTVLLPTDATVYRDKDFLIPNQLLIEESQHHQKEMRMGDEEKDSQDLRPVTSAPLNKRKILIIEDDDDVREFLEKEIGQYFEVVTEADGTAGLERARVYDADLVVCDVLMPGLTGFEVTQRLKKNFDTSHIPVILLTALSTEEKQLEGVESGADAYVVKPFSPKLLLARIFKLIEQRDKLREKFSNDFHMIRPAICASLQDKEFADKLQIIMEKQINNAQFTIDEFASMMKLGRTVFYRKVRGVTGYTPNEYMRIIRMKRAAELLAEGNDTISEISYKVGINDPFYFSKCFKQQFGVTPSGYQKGEQSE